MMRSSAKKRRQKGQGIMEFAIVLPFFLIFLLGTFFIAFFFIDSVRINREAELVAADVATALQTQKEMTWAPTSYNAAANVQVVKTVTVYNADWADMSNNALYDEAIEDAVDAYKDRLKNRELLMFTSKEPEITFIESDVDNIPTGVNVSITVKIKDIGGISNYILNTQNWPTEYTLAEYYLPLDYALLNSTTVAEETTTTTT